MNGLRSFLYTFAKVLGDMNAINKGEVKLEYPFTEEEYENRRVISLAVANYYGKAEVCVINEKYYITLESWDGIDYREISKEFFDAVVKEFGE